MDDDSFEAFMATVTITDAEVDAFVAGWVATVEAGNDPVELLLDSLLATSH